MKDLAANSGKPDRGKMLERLLALLESADYMLLHAKREIETREDLFLAINSITGTYKDKKDAMIISKGMGLVNAGGCGDRERIVEIKRGIFSQLEIFARLKADICAKIAKMDTDALHKIILALQKFKDASPPTQRPAPPRSLGPAFQHELKMNGARDIMCPYCHRLIPDGDTCGCPDSIRANH